MNQVSPERDAIVRAMRAWAEIHGEQDTQGITDEGWEGLADSALVAMAVIEVNLP